MPLLAPGEHLGPYEVLSALGAGGMGEVYRARDTRLKREVAIKVSAQRFSERFEREARAIASLNHPNICTLHDVGPNYLVLELVEGPTLADRIARGAIPLEETLTIARQIGDALEAAHVKNIVHRDLKPGNIKIKPDGTVKVLDFGLAKVGGPPAVQSEDSPTISMGTTQAGVILGTAAYMSPEQACGKTVDKRADIWSFGVVIYEMLTGRRLFKGDHASETLASVFKDQPPWDDVSPRVRRLLKKCLEKDPKRRLADIADAWGLLDDAPPLLSRLGIAACVTAGALSLALAAALWALWHVPPPVDRPLMRLVVDLGTDGALQDTITPLTISPDGRRLVLTQGGRLWMHQLDQAQSRAVPGTEGAFNPFFSPDGLWIGFARSAKLWKVSVQGGRSSGALRRTQPTRSELGTGRQDRRRSGSRWRSYEGSRERREAGTPDAYRPSERNNLSPLSAGPSGRGGPVHRRERHEPQREPHHGPISQDRPEEDSVERRHACTLLAGRLPGLRLSKHPLRRSHENGTARIDGPATTGAGRHCRLSLWRQRVV